MIKVDTKKGKKKKKKNEGGKPLPSERKKKVDPAMEIEGNQKLNQVKKLQFKKKKKQAARTG